MILLKKKFIVKIPKNISVLYCDKKNLFIFLGEQDRKFYKPLVKVFFNKNLNEIIVTDVLLKPKKKLNANAIARTTVSDLKNSFIEANFLLFSKLNLVGVGYRVFNYENFRTQIYFKLGYSHLIFFKIPQHLEVFCHKNASLFLYGFSSYNALTELSAQIRFCKRPEPYKGKGILLDQEKIALKKGKRV